MHWAHADPVRRRFIPPDQRQRFTWDGTGDDTAVIAALIGHWRYRDHYTSPDSQEEDAGDIHGPYLVAAITPTEFVPLDQAGAVAGIEEFCGLFDIPPRSEVREQISEIVLSRLGRSPWYRFLDLPEAIHQLGCILFEFRELVAILRDDGEVLLVVMGID